ncbi:MAG: hypothetical protein WDZ47_01000 [Bacteroidales bacterium]
MIGTKLGNKNLFVSIGHVYNYGLNKACYLAYLLQCKKEAIKSDPQNNGKFHLTNHELIEGLQLSEQTIRSYKKWATENDMIKTELKGSPPKQWYTIKIKATD